jgi:hypothetical protein
MRPRNNSAPFQLPSVSGLVVAAGAHPDVEDATCAPLT